MQLEKHLSFLIACLIFYKTRNLRFLCMWKKLIAYILLPIILPGILQAQQVLTLKAAVDTALHNYGSIRARQQYARSSQASVEQARRDYLPNINFGLQQDFGTVNGQNGPLYGFGGLGVASSGLPLPEQNWNAAFGALYLTNVNWDFFAFGKAKEKINVAKSVAQRDQQDLSQELFQHSVKVAAAYLNLQAAHQLSYSYRKNLDRIDTVRRSVVAKALNGLVAGVDSSLANADYANALIAYTRAQDNEQQQANQLSQLMGITSGEFILDSTFLTRIPANNTSTPAPEQHPLMQLAKSRITVSEQQRKYLKTLYYPTFSLVGILQTRGSGFGSGYAQNQHDFTTAYWPGIKPTRTNYLLGLGVTWNITQPYRLSQQVRSQEMISKGLQEEYNLAAQQLDAQRKLADTKWQNALTIYRQAPAQLKAAGDAYTQRSVLYQNGLTDLVDLSQSIYALVRAETDRDIAYNNVWQALLLKAAAAGDFSIFTSELP